MIFEVFDQTDILVSGDKYMVELKKLILWVEMVKDFFDGHINCCTSDAEDCVSA